MFSSTKISEFSDIRKCLNTFMYQALAFLASKNAAEIRNNIGGYRSLVYMDKDFFKKELEKRIDILSKKFTREEIQTNKELFNS